MGNCLYENDVSLVDEHSSYSRIVHIRLKNVAYYHISPSKMASFDGVALFTFETPTCSPTQLNPCDWPERTLTFQFHLLLLEAPLLMYPRFVCDIPDQSLSTKCLRCLYVRNTSLVNGAVRLSFSVCICPMEGARLCH